MRDGGLVRVRLDLAYDGTEFSGWAQQPGRRTVQGELEAALARVLRCPARLTVAGRTDAGVHATGQVAHVDLPSAVWAAEEGRLLRRLAGVLPADIRVSALAQTWPGFHARFGALWRRYTYRLTDAPGGGSPLRRTDTVSWPRRLDDEAVAAAAVALLGVHDFAAFCRAREGGTTVRELQRLDWSRDEDAVLVAAVQADAFCHHMVRGLVGSLLAVGEGRRPVTWPASLLAHTERCHEIPVAPARGLTLVGVGYPADAAGLAARSAQTRVRRELSVDPPHP
ncbi:MAG: tRNA pseudouridine(38-40) synthase TruA [Geodermatophilaceae bacterium]|nr:tRNA pseudouridine(38-40) synthase TruA [Geodermatophilaceae bacterium]